MNPVPRETRDRLEKLEDLVLEAAPSQNLVAPSTLPAVWTRHIADSLQLLPMVQGDTLLDIGSGAGFPGLVLACCGDGDVTLIEPRKLRAAFLERSAQALGLSNVRVIARRVQAVELPPFSTITARAVMGLSDLLAAAAHLADGGTRWVLPRGRSAQSELAIAQRSWQGRFEVVASTTDTDAGIVVAEAVRRRKHR